MGDVEKDAVANPTNIPNGVSSSPTQRYRRFSLTRERSQRSQRTLSRSRSRRYSDADLSEALDGHSLRHSLSRVYSQQHPTVSDAGSLASIDRPPSISSKTDLPLPPSKVYRPFSPHVLALLFPASIFGVLARLGIQALVGYDGRAVFPLAWVQAAGCFVMGIGLGCKEPFGQL